MKSTRACHSASLARPSTAAIAERPKQQGLVLEMLDKGRQAGARLFGVAAPQGLLQADGMRLPRGAFALAGLDLAHRSLQSAHRQGCVQAGSNGHAEELF